MLMKEQFAVKVETQISPVEIGFKEIVASVWGVTQINGRRVLAVKAIKNEVLSLGVLKHQTDSNKEMKKDSISVL